MPGEFTVELRSRTVLQDLAASNGVALRLVDCRPFDREGMVMLLELTGPRDRVDASFSAIRGLRGVRSLTLGSVTPQGARAFAVLDRPGVCRASEQAAILCIDCPFNSTDAPAKWRLLARDPADVRQIIRRLGDEGMEARLGEVVPSNPDVSFSQRESALIAMAIERGYFDFPRRVSVRDLAELVGMDESAVVEALKKIE